MVGSPGSGKTTFALQYLYHGAMLGETGLYVTLDEHPDLVKKNLQSYDWDIDGMEKKGKLLFIDASGIRRARSGDNSLVSSYGSSGVDVTDFTELLKTISKVVEGENVHRIALDPVTSLMLRYVEELKRRRAFLSHGVVLLHSLFHEGNIVRAVQIEKMRGISHDTQIRPYQFGVTGIEVFPRDKVF